MARCSEGYTDTVIRPTHGAHLLEVARIGLQIVDERRHVVERRRAILLRLRLPRECPFQIVQARIDERPAVRRYVPGSRNLVELAQDGLHLLHRAAARMIVAKQAEIERRAA